MKQTRQRIRQKIIAWGVCLSLAAALFLPCAGSEVLAAASQVRYVRCYDQYGDTLDHGTPGSTLNLTINLKSTSAVRQDTTFYLNMDIGDKDILGVSEDPIAITIPYGKDYASKEITFSCKKEGATRYSITDMDNTTVYYSNMFYVREPGIFPSDEIYLTPECPAQEISCVLPDGGEQNSCYSSDTSVVTVEQGVVKARGNGTANLYFKGLHTERTGAAAAVVYVSGFPEDGAGDWVLYGSLSALRNAFLNINLDRYTPQNNLANGYSFYIQDNRIVEPVDPSDLSFDIYMEGNSSYGAGLYSWTAPIEDDTYAYLQKNVFPYMGIYKAQDSYFHEAGYTTYDEYSLNNFCKEVAASIDNGGLKLNRKTGKIEVTPGYLQMDTDYVLLFGHNIVSPNEAFEMEVNIYFRFRTMSASDTFIDLVSQITAVAYSDYMKTYLERCQQEYDKLTDEEKETEDVRLAYEKFQGYLNVYQVMEDIYKIGEVTVQSGEAIDIARVEYDALTEEQRAMITPEIYKILTDAESAYERFIRTQVITAEKEVYTVTYGSKAFTLNTTVNGDGTLTYESDQPSVAKINTNGVVSICGVGTAIITIRASQTENFDAAEKKVRIQVSKGTQVITASTNYNNTSFPLNAACNSNAALKYTSSDTSVATVSAAGVVKVVGAGLVTITITADASDYYRAANKKMVYYFTPQQKKAYTVNGIIYKITNADTTGKGTVTVTGASSAKITSLSIKSSVKIAGSTYKVTAVNAAAFKNYKKLKKVVIGKNVSSIGKEAFRGCTALTCLQIGTGTTTISKSAFYGDKKLKKITIKSKKIKKVGANAFKGIHKKAVFKVPASKKKAYKKLLKGVTVR